MAGSITLRLLLLGAFASQAMASCAYGTLLHPRAEGKVEVNTFGYTGKTGPTSWLFLDPEANAMCATGTNQSPIDMVAGENAMVPASQLNLEIPDMTEGTEFENLGTTVEVVAGQGSMRFGNTSYTLQQFHFHLPSEHLDAGKSMAMEMHMVWESADSQIAVVGVFIDVEDGAGGSPAGNSTSPQPPSSTPQARKRDSFKMRRSVPHTHDHDKRQLPGVGGSFFHVNAPTTAATTPSNLLETVFGSVGEISEPGTLTKTKSLNMAELVSTLAAGSFQTYEGSLTTPPCSEGVRWLVSDQKLSIKTSTFHSVQSVIGFNSRFPQGALGEPNTLDALAKMVR
ncbi:alpha carbonic anhydrase [Fusarium flagelliforme]|uniref:carbonic anhydrase n=1 Tax=Fusarium flagelliforme TaxID=2675880 RepID=A0A395MHU5_9HYPO|nr:alpha carbonic anhydrase [Fusarium flagelliforme]KAH7183252.1 alpha carbonic anhydrase [Fusarium flagelliforme]RFN47464.1 periplasmic alpha-carbonic anhydrase [Fusarium flagelliforme]